MTRRGLGRGLDALISSTEPEQPGDTPGAPVTEASVDAIRPNPYQPRQAIEEAQLEELAASIRAHGLIQPLIVAPSPEGTGYTIIAGERRWRAARLAGLASVPVLVRAATEQQMLALAIIENVQRTDLNPIDAAEGYRRLMEEFGLSQTEVADLIGKSRAAVANTVRLLGLPDEIREWVAAGGLTEGHGRALLTVPDGGEQRALAVAAMREGWSVRRMEREARSAAAPEAVEARKSGAAGTAEEDPDTAAAARRLEEALGTRVEIRRRGEGGQVVVHFYSEEELDTLYRRLLRDD